MVRISQIISAVVILILVANLVLLAIGKMNVFIFFVILAVSAILAYWGIPYLRRKEK